MKGTLRATVLLLSAFTAPLAAQQHLPSNEDLRHVRSVSNPQLSPDLKHVVVTLQDSTSDGGKTHLWLLSTEGAPYRQLTFFFCRSATANRTSIVCRSMEATPLL
jgi:hypothetical protein